MIFVYNFSIDDFKLKCNENETTTTHTQQQQQQQQQKTCKVLVTNMYDWNVKSTEIFLRLKIEAEFSTRGNNSDLPKCWKYGAKFQSESMR